MHELAITQSIARIALETQEKIGANRVLSIWIDAGEMRNLEEPWVQRYFDDCTKGTKAQGASIHVNRIPVVFKCQSCDKEFAFDLHRDHGHALHCPNCGGDDYRMIKGQELAITNIEVN